MPYQDNVEKITATIPTGTALSNIINVKGMQIWGIVCPSGWDAAALTIAASADGTNFNSVCTSNGVEVSFAGVAAGRYLKFSNTELPGLQYIQLRSGTATTPVNQTADRTFTLVCAP